MLNRMFRTVRESSTGIPETFPYCCGLQITMGPDGKPRIREFGNARPSVQRPDAAEQCSPTAP